MERFYMQSLEAGKQSVPIRFFQFSPRVRKFFAWQFKALLSWMAPQGSALNQQCLSLQISGEERLYAFPATEGWVHFAISGNAFNG
jgi:hypothetical protein